MPRTSRPLQIFPIVLRRVEVAGTLDLTPNMRRITLAGDELREGRMGEGFERPPFESLGFDDHVKLVVPPADGALPRIGTQEEHRFAWNPEVFEFTRDYTVRSWDRKAGTFDIDVVRHDRGLAAAWAFRVKPGDPISFAGPKSCALLQPEADFHLLAGDETALPAIGRWLEEAPAGTRGRVIVEIPSECDRQEIDTAAEVDIEWIVRGAPAGTGGALAEAVKRAPVPEGRVYAWCAGEARTIAPIRRHLRRERGLPKEDVEVVGYWRRPETASDQTGGTAREDASRDDAERLAPAKGGETRNLLHEAHEMTELGPPIVARAAATLGIGLLVESGTATLAELSAETGVDAERLKPLIDAMTALELIETDGARYRNTALGGVLMEASTADGLTLDDPANRADLALVDLVDVLRSGRPAGAPWRERREADPDLDAAYRDRNAEALHYVLEPLGRLDVVAAASTLAVFGDAAPEVAARIAGGRTVHLPGSETAAPWPSHDCGILVSALEGRTDDEAVDLLRAALAAGPALVIAERTADKAPVDDHAAEYALTSLALTGEPLRTGDEIDALLREAGAASSRTVTLGWGFGPYGKATLARG